MASLIDLAFIRNALYDNQFTDQYLKTLLEVKETVKKNGNPYAGLINLCIDNAMTDIDAGDLTQAAEEINFIHNFPIYENFHAWDEKHFFTIELLGYIEKSDNSKRIKQIIKEMAKF